MQLDMPIADKATFIKNIRDNLGLDIPEFCHLLGLNSSGPEKVVEWEQGVSEPTKAKMNSILSLESKLNSFSLNAPFRNDNESPEFTFIDLFAGIGGIRLPFQEVGGKCVFTSEIDKFAQQTYLANFGEYPKGDITKISASDIPNHDVLLAGFPCQAFSQAGLKRGFNDTRGTMFFEIQRILSEKRPKMFLLENVKQLKGHDKGRTLDTILGILRGTHEQEIPQDIPMSEESRNALSNKLNYWVNFKVLRAADFGAPQNRERIYLVGFDKDYFGDLDFNSIFQFPEPTMKPTKVGDILEASDYVDSFTISDKIWASHQKRKAGHKNKGNGFGFTLVNSETEYTNTISARYYKDGSEALVDQSHLGKNPRMLTPRECARLQGFPENYIVDAVSKGQIYKQFGNSVCMNVVKELARNMINALKVAEKQR
ncbi:DNA (cytosine-5-)-methyltransferase [Vibrio parahaemolyticus]|uniref:DNA (cytosine-5-)-methyltransferase n=1 Tax=Vibrio parahaemolyticus TaxID=670 RepID=UPI000B339316|nr:DNA (cytosine-5-)-methyltransferase [Vibrio parahaemolyticus]EIA1349459.1 DNA (cytosine-5-)-methyltransferase [Vibrio parahaemolyticus]EIA1622300.1 DNA (cytosine-5-)-methyltransferase [Vibrio parahaemolyticus]EII3295481.1 DNA (cytosine-5-)-methyltransferase [Vibrio parahaemolyticus]EIU6831558.1 DNA (cytosine-5-)-methyltransferase [Vibrio parahaemolyticus]EIV8633627.1 DNA (cytosine-5-)-methyltransferase [Vibrio parahaemolyticus]